MVDKNTIEEIACVFRDNLESCFDNSKFNNLMANEFTFDIVNIDNLKDYGSNDPDTNTKHRIEFKSEFTTNANSTSKNINLLKDIVSLFKNHLIDHSFMSGLDFDFEIYYKYIINDDDLVDVNKNELLLNNVVSEAFETTLTFSAHLCIEVYFKSEQLFKGIENLIDDELNDVLSNFENCVEIEDSVISDVCNDKFEVKYTLSKELSADQKNKIQFVCDQVNYCMDGFDLNYRFDLSNDNNKAIIFTSTNFSKLFSYTPESY